MDSLIGLVQAANGNILLFLSVFLSSLVNSGQEPAKTAALNTLKQYAEQSFVYSLPCYTLLSFSFVLGTIFDSTFN